MLINDCNGDGINRDSIFSGSDRDSHILNRGKDSLLFYGQVVNDHKNYSNLNKELEDKKKSYSLLLTVFFTINFAGAALSILYYVDDHYTMLFVQESYQIFHILAYLIGSQAIIKKKSKIQTIFIGTLGISFLGSTGLIWFSIVYNLQDRDNILAYIFCGVNIIGVLLLFKGALEWRDKLKLKEELDSRVGVPSEDECE
jgi:Predicted membrane protein